MRFKNLSHKKDSQNSLFHMNNLQYNKTGQKKTKMSEEVIKLRPLVILHDICSQMFLPPNC